MWAWMYNTVAPELIQDRVDLYAENIKRIDEPELWSVLETLPNLQNWAKVVQQDTGLEGYAIDQFKLVF